MKWALRHTFCTRLMQRDTPIPIISKLAGHNSVETTIALYIRTNRQDKMTAVENLS